MKKILLMTVLIAFVAAITVSCKKDNSQNVIKAQLSQTEGLLATNYQVAVSNANSLATQVGTNGHYTDPSVMMEDSLYHINDSLFNVHYLTYCKQMTNGDNMMGNNMMGGNTMHGSSMMGNHKFMGDTAKVNQYHRSLDTIRQIHTAHHPVKNK